MRTFYPKSISTKLLAVTGSVVALVLLASNVLIIGQTQTRVNTLVSNDAFARAQGIAAEIAGEIGDLASAARSMAGVLEQGHAGGHLDRVSATSFLRASIDHNPSAFGSWFAEEPNLFDGNSANALELGLPGTHTNGAFAPYWTKRAEGVTLSTFMPDYAADWYRLAADRRGGAMTAPYTESSTGNGYTVASIAYPVLVDGQRIGVTGVDISLESLNERLEPMRPFGTGRVMLVSQDGNWLVGPRRELDMQPFEGVGLDEVRAAIASGQPAQLRDLSTETMPSFDRIVQPVEIPEVGITWALLLDVPSEAIAAPVREQTTMMVTGGLAVLLGVLLVLWLSAGRLVRRPLAAMVEDVRHLAEGRYDKAISGQDRTDETGSVATALETFRHKLADAARLEAESSAMRAEQEADRERKAAADRQTQAELQEFVDSIEGGFARLSQGDMTVRIGRAVAAQYEPIRGQFNDTVEKLESTLGSVVTSIGSIRTGLGEINVASNDLAQRTEQQAASLEETVAALAEVTRAVNETAQDAGRAQESAESANRNAAKGGEIVGKAVEAMRGIEQSSEKIGKIIGVIDEIAFQTNLLALNAGVEAARAGEAGRGFAVVAQEVRGLAQRSAEAAKEIKDLISTSSEQVEAGVELVSASGRSLDQIITEVGDMSRTVAEIARRAREQAVSLKEVQTAADQMDKVTQQNAAMVEEATAAAQSLAAETDELGRLIAEFKLASAQSRAAAPAQRTAANRTAPSQRPVVQMRPMAQGNAALKTLEDNWEEF